MQCAAVFADDASDAALDFSFDNVETGAKFKLSSTALQMTLLAFWQTDCDACIADMPLLATFAGEHPALRMIGIALNQRKAAQVVWSQQQMPFPTLVSDEFPGELLQRFGNTLGAVPYTVLLTAERKLCWSRTGALTAADLQQGLLQCREASASLVLTKPVGK